MKPHIDATAFGSITVDGTVFEHDVIIRPNGQVSKQKKKLSKALYGTSHMISIGEATDCAGCLSEAKPTGVPRRVANITWSRLWHRCRHTAGTSPAPPIRGLMERADGSDQHQRGLAHTRDPGSKFGVPGFADQTDGCDRKPSAAEFRSVHHTTGIAS